MHKILISIFLFIFFIGSFLAGAWYTRTGADKLTEKNHRILHYVDPMNPMNTSDKPGIAPCGMPLEPVYGEEENTGSHQPDEMVSKTPGTVRIPSQKQQLIGVRIDTATVASETLSVRTLGRIAPDENRIYRLNAATDGWMRDISGSTTGSLVKKDQVMARIYIYNNDFYTWQQQYLSELANTGRLRSPDAARPSTGTRPPGAPSPDSGVAAAAPQQAPVPLRAEKQIYTKLSISEYYSMRSKLELMNLGVGETQLKELEQTGQFTFSEEIRSPVSGQVIVRNLFSDQKVDRGTECFRIADLSHVWVIADVFNIEAEYIRPGTVAKISIPSRGLRFEAKVSDVPPGFDAVTRTLKVRLDADNPKNVLRPDMFVDVEFQIHLPPAIVIPASAVLDSGRRQTVFVALGGGYFEPRPVVTGWRSGERVEIVNGLRPGEQIVTSGNFLIDSESRMRLAAAGLNRTPPTDSPEKEVQQSPKSKPEEKSGKTGLGTTRRKHD